MHAKRPSPLSQMRRRTRRRTRRQMRRRHLRHPNVHLSRRPTLVHRHPWPLAVVAFKSASMSPYAIALPRLITSREATTPMARMPSIWHALPSATRKSASIPPTHSITSAPPSCRGQGEAWSQSRQALSRVTVFPHSHRLLSPVSSPFHLCFATGGHGARGRRASAAT